MLAAGSVPFSKVFARFLGEFRLGDLHGEPDRILRNLRDLAIGSALARSIHPVPWGGWHALG